MGFLTDTNIKLNVDGNIAEIFTELLKLISDVTLIFYLWTFESELVKIRSLALNEYILSKWCGVLSVLSL